jgi:Protein of unknown function (DUF2812).
MAGQTKFKPAMFLVSDYNREEEYLNQMSKKGWRLKKCGIFHHSFVRCDGEYRYKLDFNLKVKMNQEEYERYLSIFQEQGWEHTYSTFNGWHYFSKKYIPQTPEDDYFIYTDDTTLKQMLNRWIKLAYAIQIYFAVFFLISVADLVKHTNLLSVVSTIVGLLSVSIYQMQIMYIKGKRINSSIRPALSIYGGYILTGVMLISILLMFFLTFIQ